MAIKYRFNEFKNLFLPPENRLVYYLICRISLLSLANDFLKDTNL